MKKNFLKWLVSVLCALLAACAIITVNVYFPEKDVKKAYKSLDEMLLKQGDKAAPEGVTPPAEEPKLPEAKPVSMVPGGTFSISVVRDAFAEEDISDKLAKELAGMPEVQKAYSEMRARLAQLDALRDIGAVGESGNGSIAIHDAAKLGNNTPLVNAENINRKTVINSMAKALLKITGQPETKDTLQQAREKSAKTFAASKQEEAKQGWWVQVNARWVQK